jgi:uncharacterized protein (TIGR04255 family)
VKAIRPKFSNPPLIERAISVVFEPLNGFSLGDYGLFWLQVRDTFPVSEAVQAIEPEIEKYDGFQIAKAQIKLMPGDALPRAYFRNPDAGELIQLQADRFSFNWIKTGPEHVYPHSEATFDRFFELLRTFFEFAASRGFGEIKILQCELTNVNVIPVSDVGNSFTDVRTVLKLPDWASTSPNLFLEHQVAAAKYLLVDDNEKPFGRVHVVGQPTLRVPDNEPAYRVDITARGAPLGDGLKGARSFFDEAVSGVNGVFLSIVTQAGRQIWGERDGHSIQ